MTVHHVRQLLPIEYAKYRTHLLALDAPSRYLRFCSPVTDDLINRFCDKIENAISDNIIVGVFDHELVLIGAGHIATFPHIELALSVLPANQQQGIGSALMKHMVVWCNNRGKASGYMSCLSSNIAIKKLCSRNNIVMHTDGSDTDGNIQFSGPTAFSILTEIADTNVALADYMVKSFGVKVSNLFKG